MGKFLRKRGAAVVTSLALCASLVAPSFAASFNQLNDAINGNNLGKYEGNITVTEENGTRKVTLGEEVTSKNGGATSVEVVGKTVIIDLNGWDIAASGAEYASAIWVHDDGHLTLEDNHKGDGPDGKITGAAKSGVWVGKDSSFTMKGGEISDNRTTDKDAAGGVTVVNGGAFTMQGGVIRNNTSLYQADNVRVDSTNSTGKGPTQLLVTGNGKILGSNSENESISVIGNGSRFEMDGEAVVDGSIFASGGAQITAKGGASKDGQDFDGFTVNGTVHVGKGDTYEADEESRLDVRFAETGTSGSNGGGTTPGLTDIDDPDVPLGGEPELTEIEDEAVPLAGLFTRADAIGYLWQRSGSPDAALSDFVDVPEDHDWAVAIGWAEQNGIAVADEEGGFRPDDLLLRGVEDILLAPEGELEEFLNRYAVSAGVKLGPDELFIELDGEPDDIVMGEDAQVIFDDFFARLEAR